MFCPISSALLSKAAPGSAVPGGDASSMVSWLRLEEDELAEEVETELDEDDAELCEEAAELEAEDDWEVVEGVVCADVLDVLEVIKLEVVEVLLLEGLVAKYAPAPAMIIITMITTAAIVREIAFTLWFIEHSDSFGIFILIIWK